MRVRPETVPNREGRGPKEGLLTLLKEERIIKVIFNVLTQSPECPQYTGKDLVVITLVSHLQGQPDRE